MLQGHQVLPLLEMAPVLTTTATTTVRLNPNVPVKLLVASSAVLLP
jgi:hypothetical protein